MRKQFRSIAVRYLSEFNRSADKCTDYSSRHIFWYGIIGVLSPTITIIDHAIANTYFDTFWVRFCTAIVCVPCIARHQLPRFLREWFHIYFVLGAAFVLPFAFGLMLTMNAALTPEGEQLHMQWMLQYFIALFVFIQVLPQRTLAAFLWALVTLADLVPVFFVAHPNFDELMRVLVLSIPAFVTAVGIGILTNRHTDIIDTERLRAASAIGASLAHELRTPLASIRALSSGADKLLPTLVDGYLKARDAGIEVDPLRPNQVKQLSKLLKTIQNEVGYSNTIIDMLLVNTSDRPLSGIDMQEFSAAECVREAIERYPFNNQRERELIRLALDEDFTLRAPRLLVVHIMFNLIKNGLNFVQKRPGAHLEIRTVPGSESDRIVVHDTGVGMPPQVVQHVFDRFFTTSKAGQGAGIGLSFCKMVMDSIGGSITCNSIEDRETTFTLTFNRA